MSGKRKAKRKPGSQKRDQEGDWERKTTLALRNYHFDRPITFPDEAPAARAAGSSGASSSGSQMQVATRLGDQITAMAGFLATGGQSSSTVAAPAGVV